MQKVEQRSKKLVSSELHNGIFQKQAIPLFQNTI